MAGDLSIELVAEHDRVSAVSGQVLLSQVLRVPDSSFRHEIEACPMDNLGLQLLDVRAEEDGRSEDSLKGCNQAAVLRTALLHAKRIQHLGGTLEGDLGSLLSRGQRREKNRD
jgi:hypothetical protein